MVIKWWMLLRKSNLENESVTTVSYAKNNTLFT